MSYKDREEMKKIDDERYYTDPEIGKYTKRTAAEMEALWGDYPEKISIRIWQRRRWKFVL